MATKPMKTLKLPGLDDTYTFLQNDTTLAVSGKAADAKATGDALAAVQAQVDGVQAGQYPDMGAGQLLSTTGTVNPTPYTYRENFSGSDRVTISQITGGTVAWNQLDYLREGVEKANQYSALWSLTASKEPYLYSGHIYLCSFVQPTCAVYRQSVTGFPAGYKTYPAPTVETRQEFIVQASANVLPGGMQTYFTALISKSVTTEESYALKDKQIFDLTQMFGATVAQHFLDLETATAGAGVALFRQMFPESYYPYNAGELVSVQTSGRKSGDHTYPLDGTLTLRGIPVLTDGVPAYDGDKYAPDGTVTRRYGVRAYASGDESDATVITDGTNTVYPLSEQTTETSDPYQSIQIAGSTEEFLPPADDTRPAAVPVGSVSLYQTNLREGLETLLGTDLAHAESIAPVQGSTASTNISSGELLMQDGKLYKATQAIVAGAEIGDTNTTETTLAAQLAALEARIAALEN